MTFFFSYSFSSTADLFTTPRRTTSCAPQKIPSASKYKDFLLLFNRLINTADVRYRVCHRKCVLQHIFFSFLLLPGSSVYSSSSCASVRYDDWFRPSSSSSASWNSFSSSSSSSPSLGLWSDVECTAGFVSRMRSENRGGKKLQVRSCFA